MNIRSLTGLAEASAYDVLSQGGAGSLDVTHSNPELLYGNTLCGIGLPSYSLDIADYTAHYFPNKEMAGDERCHQETVESW
ncbi:MAG: hypothetical protein ABFD81_19505 [Syntrophaceae bacterium]